MDELTEKISDLLSSPEGMEKVKTVISLLNQNNDDEKNTPDSSKNDSDSSGQSLSGISKLLSDGTTLQMISMVQKAMELMGTEDERTALLKSLKPLLNDKRKERVDEATKILNMVKLLPLLKEQGIL